MEQRNRDILRFHRQLVYPHIFPLSSPAFSLQEWHTCWSKCGRRTRRNFTLHLYLARRLVWSPLRASSDHRFIVGPLRAQELSALTYFP